MNHKTRAEIYSYPGEISRRFACDGTETVCIAYPDDQGNVRWLADGHLFIRREGLPVHHEKETCCAA